MRVEFLIKQRVLSPLLSLLRISIALVPRDQRGCDSSHNGHQVIGKGRYNNHHGGRNPPSQQEYSSNQPTCQVYNKSSQVDLQCHYQFDHAYQYLAPTSFSKNYGTPDSSIDSAWYPDSTATHHITNDLANLNVSYEQCSGSDSI